MVPPPPYGGRLHINLSQELATTFKDLGTQEISVLGSSGPSGAQVSQTKLMFLFPHPVGRFSKLSGVLHQVHF